MIRNPIEPIVLPNPCLIDATIVSAGRVVRARKTETRKRETNALSLRVEVRKIIARMLTSTRMEIVIILIISYI